MTTRGALPLLPGVKGGVCFSPCAAYRYLLTRDWYPKTDGVRHAVFVMLNPSSAGGSVDDRTVRKCQKFARTWGYNGISVVNLFALRATDPAPLYRHRDPVGPANDKIIEAAVTDAKARVVVVAWGQHGSLRSRGLIVLERLHELGVEAKRLGPPTKAGHPWHPLYRKDTTELEAA